MLNHITIMGRMTRDPELRRTTSGKPVASFTVAVDRDYAPEGQERETDFIDCVAWNGTGEFIAKYFNKGSMIVITGRLQIRGWTDKDGNKRRSAEVLADHAYFGDSKKSNEGTHPTYGQNGYPGNTTASAGYQNQPPQNYGSYQQPAPNVPQYNQHGFGGYQQNGYPAQNYQPPHPAQGSFARIDADDAELPF